MFVSDPLVCLSFCLSLCLTISICLFLCLSLPQCLFLSMSVSVSFSQCLSLCRIVCHFNFHSGAFIVLSSDEQHADIDKILSSKCHSKFSMRNNSIDQFFVITYGSYEQ